MTIESKSVDKAKSLLKQLFRSDNTDLDFGIYRIMNFKRAEIEKFINKDLIETAETEFKEFVKVGSAELEKNLEKLKAEINGVIPGTIDDDWNVVKNRDSPRVKEFLTVLDEYKSASVSEEQIQDVFNHIFEFFSRYYVDGDFIPKIRYGGSDKYFVPYNGEEILLHWASKDMHYIKTGEYFNKYSFRLGKLRITFVLVKAQIEQGNVKSDKNYFVLHHNEPISLDNTSNSVEIRFNYRSLTNEEIEKYDKRKTQQELIDDALAKIRSSAQLNSISDIVMSRNADGELALRKYLETYVERNTKDYFILDNLESFLRRELDFYLKNEVLNLVQFENRSHGKSNVDMAKLKAIRKIALRIIQFLAQIEDFQKNLFEKKKFVLQTDYCLTLNLIPEEMYEEIGKNKQQVKDWKELYKLDEITKETFCPTKGKTTLDVGFLRQYKFMMVDTGFFSAEFKDKILEKIENIDNFSNGLIIKGDNYQALRLLEHKYSNRINCIYIDPPYNLGSDDFFYKDNYQHSSWLTMMASSLGQSRNLLHPEGVIFSSIDDNECHNLRLLMNEVFGPSNFIDCIIWKKRYGGGAKEKYLVTLHEYVLFYAKNKDCLDNIYVPLDPQTIKRYYRLKDEKFKTRGPYRTHPLEATRSVGVRKNLVYPIPSPDGDEIWPRRQWWWDKTRTMKALENNEIEFIKSKNGKITVHTKQYLRDESGKTRQTKPFSLIDNVYTQHGTAEIESLFGDSRAFLFPKPAGLIKPLIEIAKLSDDEIILDFFAGSGTTADAAIHLNREDDCNRKYILVEIGDCFESIMKKRIMKITFSNKWKDGIPQNCEGISQMVKYQYLENYEDSLNNIKFKQDDNLIQSRLDRLSDYFISYMLDFETRDSSTRFSFSNFKTPFDYRIVTLSGGEEKEEAVDLVETFNYLLGVQVQRLRAYKDGGRLYRVVSGERDHEQILVIWRNTIDLDLNQDKDFIENEILKDAGFDTLYVNGDSYIKNATPIEPEFKRLMGA